MNIFTRSITTIAAVGTTTAAANAWHFDCRFIERVGNTNVELPNNTIDASNGEPRNIRIQFGVFDDAEGPAPEGGFIGWNLGTISVGGPVNNSEERRNTGRLTPFNAYGGPNANGNPPLPAGDPFTALTDIQCELGNQGFAWGGCVDPDGDGVFEPAPMPQPLIRGRNTFVSVYAFRIDPAPGAIGYEVVAGGNLLAAAGWVFIGTPSPPDCSDPSNPQEGNVDYTPSPILARSFSRSLTVQVPSPAGVTLLLLAGPGVVRRRRTGADKKGLSL